MRRNILLGITPTLVIGLALALGASSGASPAVAAAGCSNHSLHGSYGAAISGSIFNNGSEVADLAGAGQLTFDGEGKLVGTETDSTNGQISSVTITGTYTVNVDCTGTATLVNSNGRTDHVNIVLVDNGRQFAFVDTDPGVVLAGTDTKQ